MLFTDIERSTRVLERLGDEGYAAVLADHRRICREAFDRFDGTEVDTQGDSFFVVFESAKDAIAAAEHAQVGLSATKVRVRMGVHTGRAIFNHGMYVGLDVHRGARIAAAAHGAQTVVSATSVAELVGTVELRSLGLHRLKDFGEPIELFQLGVGDHPPLRTIAPTNLPTPASSFVGRELELGEAEAVRLGGRLLTIVGAGGTGKTRFAIELARRTADSFPGGSWFVSLSALTDPALVLPAIAAAMGIDDVGENPVNAIGHRVNGMPTSILLDNLEQLTDAASDIARLVAEVSRVSILATSRTPLFVTGEHVIELDVLSKTDGVALFVERAKSAGRTVEADDPTIARLCASVDHLPLAIELLAARARLMSAAQMLTSLGNPLDIESKQRDLPARHRTLRSTLMWSHALLDDTERDAFAALSVFADGWTLEAAEEVCQCDINVINALVEHSLVRVRFSIDGQSRWWLLELVRTIAAELLDVERSTVLWERLTARCVRLLGLWSPQLNTSGQDAAFAWFDTELNDLRAVALRLIEANDPRAGACVTGLFAYLWRRGRADEGNVLLSEALQVTTMPAADRAMLHLDRAASDMVAGDLATAQGHLESGLVLIEGLDEQRLRLQILSSSGQLFMLQGEPDAARNVWEQCQAEALACGEDRVAALIDWHFGSLAASVHDWDGAATHFEASRNYHRSIDDTIGVAWLSGMLGSAHANRHDNVAASSALLEAFRTYARVGLAPGLESALIGLGEYLEIQSPTEAGRAVAWFEHLRNSGMETEGAELERIGVIRAAVGPVTPLDSGDAKECAAWAIRVLSE